MTRPRLSSDLDGLFAALLKPGRSGVVLTRATLGRLGQALGVQLPAVRVDRMLARLFEETERKGRRRMLLTLLLEHFRAWRARYEAWHPPAPGRRATASWTARVMDMEARMTWALRLADRDTGTITDEPPEVAAP